MNYLAHLFLAGDDEELLMGALLGDFVRGRIEGLPYPQGWRRGIQLHRLTDSFTDGHPRVLASKARLPPARRRYAGIIVDLAYDHFLARHWATFCDQPLADFTRRVYGSLLSQPQPLPERLQRVLPRMAAQDWLGSYERLENVVFALERLGQRLRRHNGLLGVGPELEACYDGLEEDFLEFFPDLRAFVAGAPCPPPHPASARCFEPREESAMAEPQRPEPHKQHMSPGDQAAPGTPGTGENICRECGGSGTLNGQPCPQCDGTGYVIEGIGGA